MNATISITRANVARCGVWLLLALVLCPRIGAQTWMRRGAPEGIRGLTAWDQARQPPGRSSHAMVLDEARQRIVMFGGQGSPASGALFRDTWEWDGVTWQQVAGGGTVSARL